MISLISVSFILFQIIDQTIIKLPIPNADVRFEQGGSLDQTLINSIVAMTFYSTIFLDCLRHNVPGISFDWHDFSFKQQMQEQGVLYFAESLGDLKNRLISATKGDLVPYRGGIDPFLIPAGSIAARNPAKVIRPVIDAEKLHLRETMENHRLFGWDQNQHL